MGNLEARDCKEQLDTVGKLARSLTHEIRNPLTAIDMHVSLLSEMLTDCESSYSPKVDRFLKIIRGEIKRLTEVLDHYSGFTLPHEPVMEEFDIGLEIQELKDLMALQAEGAGLKLSVTCDPEKVLIYADKIQIRQVLLNLVLNAFQATDEGGQINLEVKQYPETGSISITVIDTGIGISETVLPRIFDLFFTSKASGAGLGLSLIQRIVTDHRGSIDVESREGEGSRFTIKLPVYQGAL